MKIDRERDALLIVDLQPDFMPGGPLSVVYGDAIVLGIANLMSEFNIIVATQDWHPANHISFASVQKRPAYETIELYGKPQTIWPDHCIQGTPGADLHPDLPREPLTLILRKGTNWRVDSYSAFNENWGPNGKRQDTGLLGFLLSRGLRGLVVVGIARDYCCLWSAQDAALAMDTRVVWDLTRPVYPENDNATRKTYLETGVKVL